MKEFRIRCRAFDNDKVVNERVIAVKADNVDNAYGIAADQYNEYVQENRIIHACKGYTAL